MYLTDTRWECVEKRGKEGKWEREKVREREKGKKEKEKNGDRGSFWFSNQKQQRSDERNENATTLVDWIGIIN